jgi:hypothetical protein
MRNVEQKFGLKHAVTTAFCQFFAGVITKAQILQQLDFYLALASDKQARLIDNLLFSRDNWLPSALKQLRMFDNEITNRVEVFFGSLKQGTNHQIAGLADIAGLVKSLAETSLASLFHITNNAELPPEILAPQNLQHISRYALIHAQEQWHLVQQGPATRRLPEEYCCKLRH